MDTNRKYSDTDLYVLSCAEHKVKVCIQAKNYIDFSTQSTLFRHYVYLRTKVRHRVMLPNTTLC